MRAFFSSFVPWFLRSLSARGCCVGGVYAKILLPSGLYVYVSRFPSLLCGEKAAAALGRGGGRHTRAVKRAFFFRQRPLPCRFNDLNNSCCCCCLNGKNKGARKTLMLLLPLLLVFKSPAETYIHLHTHMSYRMSR